MKDRYEYQKEMVDARDQLDFLLSIGANDETIEQAEFDFELAHMAWYFNEK